MNKIHIQCKHCQRIFDVDSPGKVGMYNAVCPYCEQKMTFRIFPSCKPAGCQLPPRKAMTVKCPSCEAMFPASLPSNPGCYGIKCPSCKREIRIKMM